MPLITKSCLQCGTLFSVYNSPSRGPGRGQYCSKDCANSAQNHQIACTCEYCGAMFKSSPVYVKRGQMRYCSPECSYAARTIVLETRFWSKVQRCEHGETCSDCCWPWLAAISNTGYGVFSVKGDKRWHNRPAHQIAWELTYGPFPKGLQANHTCDNRPCCNTQHVYPGTHKENSTDMSRRDRWKNQYAVRLTDKMVQEIFLSTLPIPEIARQYGISESGVNNIKHKRSRAHITQLLDPMG